MNDRDGRRVIALGLFAISAAVALGDVIFLWHLELLR
jgi:hypothetical protein